MPTLPCPHLVISPDSTVLRLGLDRAERRNALTLDMYSALADALNSAARNPQVRVIVIEGRNGCFTSGNDLEDFMRAPNVQPDHPVVRFMHALHTCPKPVVAVVEGLAIGIGTTLLLHCDLVFVERNATLRMPFVSLGLCPEFASSYLLPQRVGAARAAALLMLNETFTGTQAAEWGIANAALDIATLQAHANSKILQLANQPPAALRRTKALLKQPHTAAIDAAIERELVEFVKGLQSAECKEAITAFKEKRQADFSAFE